MNEIRYLWILTCWRKLRLLEVEFRKHLRILTVLGLAILYLAGGNVFAAPVCSNTPGAGDHIDCREDSTSTSDINIEAVGIDIDLTGSVTSGVNAHHSGSGNVSINISGQTNADMTTTPSTIDTMGPQVFGVGGRIFGDGALTITLQDTEITTQHFLSSGVFGENRGHGGLTADLRTGVIIDTSGADGISLRMQNADLEEVDHIILKADGISVMTAEDGAKGIRAYRESGPGDIRMTIRNSTVVTGGNSKAHAIYGYKQLSKIADRGDGNIIIDVDDSSITTNGYTSYGIYGQRQIAGDGRISIDVESGSITTNGYASYGIYGQHLMHPERDTTGDLTISTRNHRIETKGTAHHPDLPGTFSYGIFGEHHNAGNINIDLGRGSSITTAGDHSHGIVAEHYGQADTRRIDITVGGSITVNGAGAQGVRVGTVSSGVPARMAALDTQGFRQQTVAVNGAITSAAEGVYLAGGGRVIIGSEASIRSGSGIAILATGTVSEDSSDMNNVIPAIPPKLRVDLNPGGQRMTGADGWLATALGGGWIINDGGGTSLAVNDVVLHEAAMGVVADAVAHNGVWDVTLQAPGRTVTDHTTDPWTIADRVAGVIADRDFNAEDFVEEAGMCLDGKIGNRPDCMDPPPPMCPDGQVGTPPNCTTPPPPVCPPRKVGTYPDCSDPPPPETEPELSVIMERYAPRAALYEALPNFLLGLQTTDLSGHSLRAATSSVWIELSGHTGSQAFDYSSVGAWYDTEHRVVSVGGTVLESSHWKIDASAHDVSGSADVSSPVKGGDIHAQGQGLSFDAHWHSEHDYYVTGGVSWTGYDLDISSDNLGRLISNVDADRLALEVEAGRRMALGERWHWTPHIRVDRTRVRIDSFTDAVQSRVSFSDEARYSGSVGVMMDTMRPAWGGELLFSSSLSLAHRFGDTATIARVSGEQLRAEPEDESVHVGLGVVWQQGPWSVNAALSAREAGSGNYAYSGTLHIGMQF